MSDRRPPLVISVVVPHLNQPDYLGNCLASLHQQTFGSDRVEITVVDNGSQELPTDICALYDNVRLIDEPTPGPGPARNKGISVSKAPILAFIDADCIADPHWLEAIAEAFEDPRTQIIGGDVRIALADPNRMTMLEAYESVYAYRQQEYIERQSFSGTGNLAMRRSIYEAVGQFAGIGVAEDREWGRRATAKGHTIHYVPGMKVFHPARKSFAELCVKWNRHVAHDYAEQVRGLRGRLLWTARAAALAASPVWEIGRIALSDRLSTPASRFHALVVLTRIRFYRARRAVAALRRNGRSDLKAERWNRA